MTLEEQWKAVQKQLKELGKQAQANTAKAWDKITNRIGRDKQIKAIRANRAAWPKVVG